MGLEGLKKLKQKKNRIYLILVLWLIGGFTVIQFNMNVGMIIFAPLLVLTVILFTVAFILRKDIKEMGGKSILKYVLISIPIIVIFASLMVYLFLFMVILSILSYILIVAVFSMNNLFYKSVEFDGKLYDWPTPINFIARSTVFGGGLLTSIIFMFIFALAGTAWPLISEDISGFFAVIPWLMIGVFILLAGITFLFLLIGKFNAWIGVFFIWVSLFAFYLMFKTFFNITSSGGTSNYGLPIQIGLFVFDLYLVLSTLGSLIGKRADIISSKIKYINSDAIIIWLIFSKATYEFLNAFPGAGVSTLKSVGSFILFIPLFFFMGLRGIYKYSEIKARRKERKREKKRKKKGLPPKKEKKSRVQSEIKKGVVYCSKCGNPNKEKSSFCSKCGAEMSKP